MCTGLKLGLNQAATAHPTKGIHQYYKHESVCVVQHFHRTLSFTCETPICHRQGRAHFVSIFPPERDRALSAARRKYWMYTPVFALGKMLIGIGLMRNRTGAFEVTLTA